MRAQPGSKPEELERWLKRLTPSAVERTVEQVEALLAHRSAFVRMEAAQALTRAGIGALAARKRLDVEKNSLVLTDLAEALASAGDRESLPQLKALAEHHGSKLVRSYALQAVADLERSEALPFLRARLSDEVSRRVRATLNGLLFVYGDDDALGDLLACLRSRDFWVRAATNNLLAYYRPRRKRREIIAALREAARVEPYPGQQGEFEKTARSFEGKGGKRG